MIFFAALISGRFQSEDELRPSLSAAQHYMIFGARIQLLKTREAELGYYEF